jgi:hypothetical protein
MRAQNGLNRPASQPGQPAKIETFLDRDNWTRALLAADLPRNAVCLGIAIALHLHIKSGRCDPSSATLATDAHVGERSVYRLINLLERSGWIATNRSLGIANQYTLCTPTTATHVAVVPNPTTAKTTPHHCQNDPEPLPIGGRQTGEQRGTAGVTPPAPSGDELHPDKGAARRGSTDDTTTEEAFGRFWSAYPKHTGKDGARREIRRALKRATAEQIIAGAQRYAVERADENPRYTKDPANWLGCWTDEAGGTVTIDEHGIHRRSLNDEAEQLSINLQINTDPGPGLSVGPQHCMSRVSSSSNDRHLLRFVAPRPASRASGQTRRGPRCVVFHSLIGHPLLLVF